MKIVFTGGGTGGHVFPIVAIVRELKKLSGNFEFYYLGPKDDFAKKTLLKEGIRPKWILAGKLRRYLTLLSPLANSFDLFVKIPLGFLQAFCYLFFLNPDLIFSKGGYGSFPVVLAGWLLGTPVFLHESDCRRGLANKILGIFASKIFISFPQTEGFKKGKMILSGNPIRNEIFQISKEKAFSRLKLLGGRPVILVLGGSQGAQRINDQILGILKELVKGFEIIHQTGEKNFQQVKAEAEVLVDKEWLKYYHPYPFLEEEDLGAAFVASDLIIARAGAGTIFEIAYCGKPSILIPLPEAAQDHQLANAYAFAKEGGAIVMEEENLSPRFLLATLRLLFSEPERLQKMGEKAKQFSMPEAAKKIANYIFKFLTG